MSSHTTGTTNLTNLRWQGQYQDPTTGLYYMRARWYDPQSGQFLTQDPLVAATQSPYAFGLDDPINLTDPTGLAGCPWNGCPFPVRVNGNWVQLTPCQQQEYQAWQTWRLTILNGELQNENAERAYESEDMSGGLWGAYVDLRDKVLQGTATVIANSPIGWGLGAASQFTGVSIGGCINGEAYSGPGATASVCYYATPSGQSGITVTAGGGGGTPFVSLSGGPSFSNARTLTDLSGNFAYLEGGSGPITGSASYGLNDQNKGVWSSYLGYSPSDANVSALPFSISSGGTNTQVFPAS